MSVQQDKDKEKDKKPATTTTTTSSQAASRAATPTSTAGKPNSRGSAAAAAASSRSSATPASGSVTANAAKASSSSAASSAAKGAGKTAIGNAADGTPKQLNVKDALTYLDQVKLKFEKQPEIYNRFLDIMKDFKTHTIDTPGVIDRVSTLFRNHPSLISGFNTFLPNGFRIECQSEPGSDAITIAVITPHGTQKLTPGTTFSGSAVSARFRYSDQVAAAKARAEAAAKMKKEREAATAAGKPVVASTPTSAKATPAPSTSKAVEGPKATPSQPAVAANKGTAAATPSAAGPSRAAVVEASKPAQTQVKSEDKASIAALASTAPATSTVADTKPVTNAASAAPAHQPSPGLPAAAQAPSKGAGSSSAPQSKHSTPSAAPTKQSTPTASNSKQNTPTATTASTAANTTATVKAAPSSSLAAPATNASSARNSTPAAANTLTEPRTGRPPIEFNHAISYVNKIKLRFTKEPEIYKTFLDILQTYQKEQRPIKDVYAQVTLLFKNAPDLLDEFKQFLPDHSQPEQLQKGATTEDAAQSTDFGDQRRLSTTGSTIAANSGLRTKPKGPSSVAGDDYVPPQSVKRKRPGHNDSMAIDVPVTSTSTAQPVASAKQKSARGSRKNTGLASGVRDPPTLAQQSDLRYDHNGVALNGYPQPIHSYLPPRYVLPGANVSTQTLPPTTQETPEEKIFFDRIAEFIDDKFTYYEFLKLLNLYTQDIVDLPTLVSRAWLFIGGAPDLWADFRELVGWRDGSSVAGRTIENGEWIVENVPAIDRKSVDLTKCEAAGPSYRRLPQSEIQMNCSGRDQLCWEVLNDEWVNVMSLGSEETFLAHKKNPFEEALHRTEEERHEYDFHIEANLRTIALLEPIAAKIATMEPEERIKFKLRPGLGGQSKSIYQRIIKKVYGRELGREVVQALHENPCLSIPVVLTRLKQKDEEWRRALREWNRVWREVDAKNFFRSLDHQGITFKAQDKRYISSKSLVSEIESQRRTEMQKKIALPMRLRPPAPTYQFAYAIEDENVLFDSLKLFLSYLDRAPGNHTMAERDRIEAFLRSLTSLVFAIPVSVLDSMLTPVQDAAMSESVSDVGEADGGSESAASSADLEARRQSGSLIPGQSTTAAKKADDLRKKVMMGSRTADSVKGGMTDGEQTPASSRGSTPALPQPSEDTTMIENEVTPSHDVVMEDSNVVAETASKLLQDNASQGDSTFKKDVPTSAAGLEGMQGVETVQVDKTQGEQGQSSGAQTSALPSMPTGQENQPHIAGNSTRQESREPNSATSSRNEQPSGTPVIQPALPQGQPQIRRFNFFCNTPYYTAIRLLHILYSRLHIMKESARSLSIAKTGDALSNSSFTAHGRANPHFSGQHAAGASALYDGMLELCEKLFGSEIDQIAFEDGLRALFGNTAYHMFTIDKVLSALVKTVWSLIDSNREAYSSNGEIFKYLVDDRRHPTTAQAQQMSYRHNAELAAGSEQNLYRIEWMPRRHLLSFQVLGKDEILPEDESDLSRLWEQYIRSYLGDEVTADLPFPPATKNIYLARNVRTSRASTAEQPQLFAKSELESRICMRSYRMFWQKKTEDAMHRAWSGDQHAEKAASAKTKRKQRWSAWLAEHEKARAAPVKPTESLTDGSTTAQPEAVDAAKPQDGSAQAEGEGGASQPPETTTFAQEAVVETGDKSADKEAAEQVPTADVPKAAAAKAETPTTETKSITEKETVADDDTKQAAGTDVDMKDA